MKLRVKRLGGGVLVLVAAMLVAGDARAACRSTCTEELRACGRTCAPLHGRERRDCRQRCADASTCSAPGVRLRTTAYAINECSDEAGKISFAQKLVVRRGNCDPVTVMELPAVEAVPDPLRLCDVYGQFRVGNGSLAIGRFQRLAVSPDGRWVVVEVTNDHSIVRGIFPDISPEPPEEGIFLLPSDGKGPVRRLGPQSAIGILKFDGVTIGITGASPIFQFNARGSLIAYEDMGPGPDGSPASQVFVIDLTSPAPEPRQVTRLPPTPPQDQITGNPLFVDDRTMVFWNGPQHVPYLIGIDGSNLRPVPAAVAVPGAVVLPQFAVSRGGTNVFPYHFPIPPKVSYAPGDDVRELFIIDGARILQLTNYGYPDTGVYGALGRNRVFFSSSADPLGTNPQGICQIFSVSVLGSGLRQLTRFPADGPERHGCLISAPNIACKLNGMALDRVTNVLTFLSSCDPLGRNPNGEQGFSMRLDGTGLRQTTAFRGVERIENGVHVEMAGPIAYSTVFN